jgi:hypothetical protein
MTDSDSVRRTSAGLREALFDEIDRLRRGEIDPKRVNAIARISAEIVSTVKMEIEVANYMAGQGRAANVGRVLKPLDFEGDDLLPPASAPAAAA